MDRKKLIEGLANVAPALSVSNSGEIMKTFWLTGKRLMAYNGNIALSVAMPSEFIGAVQGTLYPLLNSSAAAECEFVETDKGVTVKAGSSKFKLLSMDAEQFNFKMPKFPEEGAFPIADVPKFLIALKACKRSLGSETSESVFKGITMIGGKKLLHLFAYDRVTLTHCKVKLTDDAPFDRVVVPTAVIDQLIRITEGATELDLFIDDKILLARCSGVTLWGQLEDQDRQMRPLLEQAQDYRARANSSIDITDKDFAKKFPAMLERAIIITQSAVEVTQTRVTIAENKIALHSKSSRGSVDDTIMPGKGQTHGDVELKMPPQRVLDGLEMGATMSMTKDAVIISNSDQSIVYFVACD
jgi:hypothetical protein